MEKEALNEPAAFARIRTRRTAPAVTDGEPARLLLPGEPGYDD